MKKAWTVLFALCLCAALLAGCGGSSAPAAADAPAAEEPAGEELVEYVAEGVGTFYLPEGFEMNVYTVDQPFPRTAVDFTKGDVMISGNRNGKDAYDAVGLPLPADVEEFSQREGTKKSLPEGQEYAWDEYGNMAGSFTNDDGMFIYDVLLQGTEAFGSIRLICPEGTEGYEDFPVWATQAKLD